MVLYILNSLYQIYHFMKKDNTILDILLKYMAKSTDKSQKIISRDNQKCSTSLYQIEKAYSKFKVEPIKGLHF